MKRNMLLAATAITVMIAGTATAQTTQPQISEPPAVQPETTQPMTPETTTPETMNQGTTASGAMEGQPHWDTTSLEDLIGRDVYDAEGNKVGEVADVILDSSTREATVAIIDHGGFLGLGTKQAAIDVNLLHSQDDRIVVDGMTKEQLQAMENFDYDDATVSLGRESRTGAPATNSTSPTPTPTPAPQ